MHEMIRQYPLASLVTISSNGLNANHIPMHLITSQGTYGNLQGHVARTNPLLGKIGQVVESLAIFNGPNAYITPSWYETKKEDSKVVATWNYAAVHAYGTLKIIDDPEWLRTQLVAITDQNEAQFLEPWSVTDAPLEFTEKLLASIVGIEMKITKILCKWKVSQNQPLQNRESVIQGLDSLNQIGASKMRDLVKEAP